MKISVRASLEAGGLFDLDRIKAEFEELEKAMESPSFWQDQERAEAVSRRHSDLKSDYRKWSAIKREADDLFELVSESDEDFSAEIRQLAGKFHQLDFQILFAGKYDSGDAIVSIHAGTGGVDAQDWADILFRLYLRFGERHDFKVQILDRTPGAEAGIKSVVLFVSGRFAYGWLKSENGVHRLVRISPFDAEKMRHTSFALVEVLPDIEGDQNFLVNEDELKIDVMRAGGHGGQSVNTTDSAVRITHIPTGIAVKCQNERSQVQNKKKAMKILTAKLLKYHENREDEKLKKIKGEYQQAEWGNQARSYVMQPYQLVKDHRTDHETADIARVLDGQIDDFAEAYLRSKVGK